MMLCPGTAAAACLDWRVPMPETSAAHLWMRSKAIVADALEQPEATQLPFPSYCVPRAPYRVTT